MPTFGMLRRLDSEAVRSPKALEELKQQAMRRVRERRPGVEWLSGFAVLGPYDDIEVSRAEDIETATKVSAPIRSFGHAHAEAWR